MHLPSQPWTAESFSHHITLTLTLLPSSFTYKDACDYSGPAWTILPSQDQLITNLCSICRRHSSLPCNITYSQIPGIRLWTSFGGHYYTYCKGRQDSDLVQLPHILQQALPDPPKLSYMTLLGGPMWFHPSLFSQCCACSLICIFEDRDCLFCS